MATNITGAEPAELLPVAPPAPAGLTGTATPPPAHRTRPDRRSSRRGPAHRIAGAVLAAGLLVLGLVMYLYGLSWLSEHRVQNTMYKSFTAELAAGVAPIGRAAEGTPVAVLNIPEIGIVNEVVVEGTSARDLTMGPGHVVASALPGQRGVSVVYGKLVTFGAPFAHLMRLNRGDLITATTDQGTATYRVESFGDNVHPAPDTTANRLVLMTADPSAVSDTAVQLSADLQSPAQPNPGGRPPVPYNHNIMATDPDSLVPLVLWSQALLAASVAASVGARYWARWPTYLCVAPIILAVSWNIYENVAGLLPNVY